MPAGVRRELAHGGALPERLRPGPRLHHGRADAVAGGPGGPAVRADTCPR